MNTALDILDQAAVFTPTVVHLEGFTTAIKVKRAWDGPCMYLSGPHDPHVSDEDEILLPLVPATPYRAQRSAYALWGTVQCEPEPYVPDIVMFVHPVGAYGLLACRNLSGPPEWSIRE